MLKLLKAAVAAAACCGSGLAGAQTVEFRVVEREGQTAITSAADATLNMAVQARVVGGQAGTALGNFYFDVVVRDEPEAFGLLEKGLISNADGTYATTIEVSNVIGRGGLARQYAYLAGIIPSFNGSINVTAGTFLNTAEQEIGLISGAPLGGGIVGIPGIDMNADGTPDTYPGTGETAPLDPGAAITYLGADGSWSDVYRFRYTVSNLSARTVRFDLRNVGVATFRTLRLNSGLWGPNVESEQPSSFAAATIWIAVSESGACCGVAGGCAITSGSACVGAFRVAETCAPTPCLSAGACCTTSGECRITFGVDCTTQIWMAGASCSLSACAQPGACCDARGGCTLITQSACTGTAWSMGGTCSPNVCAQPGACCSTGGACSLTQQSGCSGAWNGSGTCGSAPCPPAGSCCSSMGACTQTLQSGCAMTWTSGAACSPNPCLILTTCCNATSGACTTAGTSGSILYSYTYLNGNFGYARNDSGGAVQTMAATFSPVTKRLVFDATFAGATTGGPLITQGFWLVLDNGPNPKHHPGELAIFYFDATVMGAPKLSVYAYNGASANDSWRDGDPAVVGDQPGDLIKGVYEASYINTIIAEDVMVSGQLRRHFMFDIDASGIVSHVPGYPAASPWYGTGFDRAMGLWFHGVGSFAASYESSGGGTRGALTALVTGDEGWLDGANIFVSNNDPCPMGSRAAPGAVCTPTNTCPQARVCCGTMNTVCLVVAPSADCPTGYVFASPAASACSPNPCPSQAMQASGTCCNRLTGMCAVLPLSGCGATTHVWRVGETCAGTPCPPVQGACCNVVTGGCGVTSQSACAAAAHDWVVGGTCGPNLCSLPGVCCNTAAGTCRRLTRERCATGGTWAPTGTCSPNPCVAAGRCCNVVTGTCQMAMQGACATGGHDWMPGGSCSPNPCAVPGTCCNAASGMCRRLTLARCAAGSNWARGGTCTPNSCVLPGACCNVVTGACQVMPQTTCAPAGHDWMQGATCVPSVCEVTGACCNLATGACRRFTQERCTVGNVWVASGVCVPSPCSMPQGACCNVVTGTCGVSYQSACGFAAHDWRAGGTCSPNTCDVTAACCNAGTGVCRRLTETRCMAVSGTWMMGRTCGPNPCVSTLRAACAADFNHSGQVGVEDIVAFLSAWFASDPIADMNDSGEIDAADVFDYVSQWFAGC